MITIELNGKLATLKQNLLILTSLLHTSSELTDFLRTNITPDTRAQLINWIIEVHTSTSTSPTVLFSTVRLLDYYFSCVASKDPSFSLQKLALLGTTCMQIQSKFCENSIMDISLICRDYLHGNSSEEEVLNTEIEILTATNFKLNLPTEYMYVSLYRYVLDFEIRFSSEENERIEILLRMNIHSYKLAQCDQSLIAAATLYTSKNAILEPLCTISHHPKDAILKMSALILEEECYVICTFG